MRLLGLVGCRPVEPADELAVELAPSPLPPETLTFGVVGSSDEVDAYRQMASLFAPLNRQVTVQVKAWPNETRMMADLKNRPVRPLTSSWPPAVTSSG